MTVYEYTKELTDNELAKFISEHFYSCPCEFCNFNNGKMHEVETLRWLQSTINQVP